MCARFERVSVEFAEPGAMRANRPPSPVVYDSGPKLIISL
jgi:hypothetical protein